MQVGVLQSIQVGTPQRYEAPEAWETFFFRAPSMQPRWLYTTHLDGNRQADTKNHGQLNQAVLLYAAA
jgi:MOSC domain-containing protein YiiM